jgi:rhodanese-related sulfurtransferase
MTGHRSSFVAHALKKKGYARIYNLTGGMAGWKIYEWISQLGGNQEPPKIS